MNEGERESAQFLGWDMSVTSARSRFDSATTTMSDLEGTFDVIVLGTGLVESITAAYVMHSCQM